MKNLFQKRVAVLILAAFLFSLALPVQAASTPAVVRIVLTIGSTKASVNSIPQTLDATPFIRDSRTYVPVRFIAESMGAKVGWVQSEQKVTIELDKNVIWLWIGKKTAKVNSKDKDLDAPPVIESNRTFVPVRFVTENLGAVVDWDNANQAVTITYKNPSASTASSTPTSKPTSSTATPVAAWMLTDQQIQAALDKGNSFNSADEHVNYLLGDFGSVLPNRPGMMGGVFLMTPYARIVEAAYNVKVLNTELANAGVPEANLSYTLADAKKEAAQDSHELQVMFICYGTTEKFYQDYKCQLALASGTILQPKGTYTLGESGLMTGLPAKAKYGAALNWSFDTTKIPRDAKLDVKLSSSSGEQTATFDLSRVK